MSHPIAAGKSSFDLVDWQRVCAELRLQPDTVLLDLACGAGNYALAAAPFIGGRGAIHAFDLWAEGIATLRERAAARGFAQIRPQVADVSRPLPLPPASIDVALLATVLHDLVTEGKGTAALAETARVLRPGGRLVVIEFEKVDGPPGPPAAIRLTAAEVEALVEPHGFRRATLTRVGDPLYLLAFTRDK